ncbi:MAG: NAD(P)-dependent oxidoreductase [Asticcacaulis sp.]
MLVTGATGGLGLAVTRALIAAGHQVRATGRNAEKAGRLIQMGAEFRPASLLDPQALPFLTDSMDGVIHCAALSSPWGRYGDFHEINVVATRRLMVMARAAGAKGFVFVSSPSVYARTCDQTGLTEDDPITEHPLNAYAATKALAEAEVSAASDSAMACVSIRPRAIVGPDDTVLLPRVLRLIDRGRFPLVRGGQALIELTDVRDVAQALVTALERAENLRGDVINISGGKAMRLRDMIRLLSEARAQPVRIIDLPWPLAAALARTSETVCRRLPGQPEPPITFYGLSVLAFSQTFDLTKARRLLDYAPRHDAFATALELAATGGTQ